MSVQSMQPLSIVLLHHVNQVIPLFLLAFYGIPIIHTFVIGRIFNLLLWTYGGSGHTYTYIYARDLLRVNCCEWWCKQSYAGLQISLLFPWCLARRCACAQKCRALVKLTIRRMPAHYPSSGMEYLIIFAPFLVCIIMIIIITSGNAWHFAILWASGASLKLAEI